MILLMTAAFYLLFQSVVYRPLEKLLAAMDKAKTGNLAVEVVEKEKLDEFGLLSNEFNSMMAQIREMTTEREKHSDILQEKVREATSALSAKNEQLETANLELFRAARANERNGTSRRRRTNCRAICPRSRHAAQFNQRSRSTFQVSLPENSKDAMRLQTISAQIERIENIVREMLDRARFGVIGAQTS